MSIERQSVEIRPQPRQDLFLQHPADVVIYGGTAGAGKTRALLMAPIKYLAVPTFSAIILRRTYPLILKPGGVWDESKEVYQHIGGVPLLNPPRWRFPSGATVTFQHLESDQTVYEYKSAQIPLIMWDQIEEFCLHPDTDVLTDVGWKRIGEVEIGERVASLTTDERIEYRRVSDVFNGPCTSGELIHVDQRTGLRFAATSGHRFVVRSQRNDRGWKFQNIEEFKHARIVRRGNWEAGNELAWYEIPMLSGRGIGVTNANQVPRVRMDDWLSFLGWWFSEGGVYLQDRLPASRSSFVHLCQTGSKSAQMRDAIAATGYRFHEVPKTGMYWISSRQLYLELEPLGTTYTKRIPRWIFSLSKRQMRLFWDAFVAGDGWYSKTGGITITLANQGLIDDLQEMSVLLGLIATTSEGLSSTSNAKRQRYRTWTLNVSRPGRGETWVDSSDFRREAYTGNVCCLTVPGTETFLARYKGRCFWSGNSEQQWWYLFSRNRSACGVKPKIRATCNPDAESWLAGFLAWWIDQDTGYPIEARGCKIRWMARDGDSIVWGNTRDDVIAKLGPETLPKSVSFVPAKLEDNPALTRKDPGYRANLQMLTTVERERLLHGNWKIRPQAGIVFPRTAWKFCQSLPEGCVLARYVDKAATASDVSDKGARTACVLLAVHGHGDKQRFFVVDVVAGRWGTLEREQQIRTTAELDRAKYGHRVSTHIEEEGGSGGKSDAEATVRNLAGFAIYAHRKRTAKHVAWKPFACQVQKGNCWIVTDSPDPRYIPEWAADFIRELDALAGDPKQDERKLKDCADAASGAFDYLTGVAALADRELLCSGDKTDETTDYRQPLTRDEIEQLPDDIASILRDIRENDGGRSFEFD